MEDDDGFGIVFDQKILKPLQKPSLPLPIPVRIGLVGHNGRPVPFRLTPDAPYAEEHVVLITSKKQLQLVYPKINK